MATTTPFMTLLRDLRKARDLSQEALAQRAFCGLGTVKSLEVGRRRPSRELAAQLAAVLGLSDAEREAFLAVARAAALSDRPAAAAAGPAADEPPDTTRALARRPLPHQITPFIGRERELDGLLGLIAQPEARLITLVAPGGMGKTRLALAAAAHLRDEEAFPDGEAFAALAPVSDPAGLEPILADALGLPLIAGDSRSARAQLLDYLREKLLLLVLDNCEHLREAVAELAGAILAEAPDVTLLATSRERLGLRAERQLPLDGMATEADGVRLFALSAQAARPAFALGETTRPLVAAICARLGGMPLAIELAAGWADTLSLAEIAAELGRGDEILTSQASDLAPRHRSVRAVCDATWGRLTPPERAIFAQVAVFHGGGTRRALQAVTGASLGQLQALVGKALLRYDPERERYGVHELLRQYAAEQLRDDVTAMCGAQDRHAAYYLGALSEREAALKGAAQREALDQIGKDIENVRAAWAWAADHGALDLLAGAAGALRLACEWLGRSEDGRDAMRAAGPAAAATPALHATLMAAQARFAFLLGDVAGAAGLLAQAQVRLDGQSGAEMDAARAQVLLELGRCAASKDPLAARDAFAQSHALFHVLDDQWGMATTLVGLGVIAHNLSSGYDEAQRYLEQSVARYRALGDRVGLSEALSVLSTNTRLQSRVPESELLAREAYALAQEIGNPRAVAQAGISLGAALSWNRKNTEAIAVLREALAIFEDLGHRAELPAAYIRLGYPTLYIGHYAEARAIFTSGLAIGQEVGSAVATYQALGALSLVSLAEGAYAEASRLAEESIALSRSLGDEYILSESLGIDALARRRLGDPVRARRDVVSALRLNLPARIVFHFKLWAITLLLADGGAPARAAEAFALAELHWPMDNVWTQDIALREIRAIIAALPPETLEAARLRWAGRDVWEAGYELLAELEADGWGAEG